MGLPSRIFVCLSYICFLTWSANGKTTISPATSRSSTVKNSRPDVLRPVVTVLRNASGPKHTSHNNATFPQARSLDDPDAIATNTPDAKSQPTSPEEKSMMDFDSLPISPLGGYKKYSKSYVNMPGYNVAKEKLEGGGLQPVAGMVPMGGFAPGMMGPGMGMPGLPYPQQGFPGGGFGGPLVTNQIPMGFESMYGRGLPPTVSLNGPTPMGNGGGLEPGHARFIDTMRQRNGFPGGNRQSLGARSPPMSKPLPGGCKCAKHADCRDVSAFARDFDDNQGTFNGHCLPGFMVCCNPEAQDQVNLSDNPHLAKAVVGPISAPLFAAVPLVSAVAASVPGAPFVKLPQPTNFNPVKKALIPNGAGSGASNITAKSHLGRAAATCGAKGRNPTGRLLDNANSRAETDFGEFPWMAAVLLTDLTYICGGALIGDRFVVTAAHCVNRRKDRNLVVRLGEYDVSNTEEPPYQDIKVSDVVIHSGFHAGTLDNDIAMLVLETPVVYNEYVSPVCLPEPDFVPSASPSVTGWGKDHIEHGKWANKLKSVDVPLVAHGPCESSYRKAPQLGNEFNLANSFLCAGSPGKDACYGDGGSPLVGSKDPDSEKGFRLLGLVSWGIDCGKYPGVYVRIQSVTPWILDAMKQFNGA